jgi:hypothetical protein
MRYEIIDHSLLAALRSLEIRDSVTCLHKIEIPDAHYIAANARILSVPLTGRESEKSAKLLLMHAVDSVGSLNESIHGRNNFLWNS